MRQYPQKIKDFSFEKHRTKKVRTAKHKIIDKSARSFFSVRNSKRTRQYLDCKVVKNVIGDWNVDKSRVWLDGSWKIKQVKSSYTGRCELDSTLDLECSDQPCFSLVMIYYLYLKKIMIQRLFCDNTLWPDDYNNEPDDSYSGVSFVFCVCGVD